MSSVTAERPGARSRATGRVSPTGVLLVACLGAFLAFLDATIVNVAFPSMQEAFDGASIGALSWVLNGYNIVLAAFLVVLGRFTDLLGRRRVFVAGVVVFTAASALCASATTVGVLVAFRVVQALGAAMLVPASLALVVAAFPPGRRAHAIGLWGASAAVAASLGPPVGGLLVELGGWPWAFLVNVPVGLLALVAARRTLVESRAPGRRRVPDLAGAVLLALAMAALNLGIVKGSDWGWSSLPVLGSLAAAVLLTGLFALSSRRHPVPLLDPALLRIRGFSVSTVATVVAGVGFFAYLLTNILWLQHVWGYSVVLAGLALVPGALVAAVVAAALGPVAERHGHRPFVVVGALLWAAAYLWYHRMTGLSPAFWSEWLPGQVLSGVGAGATLPLLGSAGLAAVPGGRYATASAVSSSARQLGGVLGVALLVVVVGDPATPRAAVDAFRSGWVLSIVAFLGVAVVALALGRDEPVDEAAAVLPGSETSARVLDPAPPEDWAPDPRSLAAGSWLAGLAPQARTRLERSMSHREVLAGSTLVAQGEPAGPAYLVQSGRLRVEVDDKPVREIGPGSVVGELALLTGEPRSAGLRALRDSSVLELPREAFEELVRTDHEAAHAVLSQMADRLQTAAPAGPSPPQRVGVVSVLALGAGVDAEGVAAELTRAIGRHRTVVSPGRVTPPGCGGPSRTTSGSSSSPAGTTPRTGAPSAPGRPTSWSSWPGPTPSRASSRTACPPPRASRAAPGPWSRRRGRRPGRRPAPRAAGASSPARRPAGRCGTAPGRAGTRGSPGRGARRPRGTAAGPRRPGGPGPAARGRAGPGGRCAARGAGPRAPATPAPRHRRRAWTTAPRPGCTRRPPARGSAGGRGPGGRGPRRSRRRRPPAAPGAGSPPSC